MQRMPTLMPTPGCIPGAAQHAVIVKQCCKRLSGRYVLENVSQCLLCLWLERGPANEVGCRHLLEAAIATSQGGVVALTL